MVLPVLCAAL
jgi:hypothetical protein